MQNPSINYNPDVLSCLANLSNDEVFTSPALANQMLDLLPQELFRSSTTTFLDPATKSGVFLREIAKRLLEGLKDEIPDLQTRINHILTKQIFGLGITELTALLARRTLYCSREANGKYSVCEGFNNPQGNIFNSPLKHQWENGRCVKCGVNEQVNTYKRGDNFESYAYAFIHKELNEISENIPLRFDVIIGNPPYQLGVGNDGGNSSKAKSIYHLFIETGIKLEPTYLCMITPSRWMTKSTEGIPNDWIDKIISSNKFKIIHDFETSNECFPGVPIEGGINYFLWDKNYIGKCNYYYHTDSGEIIHRYDYLSNSNSSIVIRDPRAFNLIDKIVNIEGNYFENDDSNFSSLVSPKDFFTNKKNLTSKWGGFSRDKTKDKNIKYYLNKTIESQGFGWISEEQIPKNIQSKDLNKVYIPAANGSKSIVLGKPFYGEPNSVCSQTYLVIGYDPKIHTLTKVECENIISYIQTKFFRYLVSIKKKTQNGPRGVYQFVPMQDFSKPWTDKELYEKYQLTQSEIEYIESMIRPMTNE